MQVLAQSFAVRLNVQVPATARHVEDQPKCQANTSRRGHRLGLAEDLDDVSVSQALPQLQPVVSYSFSCRLDQTVHLQKLLVRRSSSNPARHWVARLVCNTFLSKSVQHTFDLHVIVRQIHIRTHWRVTRQITGFRQSQILCTNELVSLIKSCTKNNWMRRDEMRHDPPCVARVDSVSDVETAGGTCSAVGSANLTLFHVRFCVRRVGVTFCRVRL